MIKHKKIRKKNYCSNCGKFNHKYKDCKDPITSLGIINIKLDKHYYDSIVKLSDILKKSNKKINIHNYNNNNLKDIKCIYKFKKLIQFLLIRRKNSLNYIEFLRGRYDTNDIDKVQNILNLMTNNELQNIFNTKFDDLWNKLWNITSKLKIYEKEYISSKQKCEQLLLNNIITSNLISKYDSPEWGFPKGRRNIYETNLETAIREFEEETNLNSTNYFILDWVKPIEENYIGTNNIAYKHIYFLAISSDLSNVGISQNNIYQQNEIGDIGWYNYNCAIKLIRDYYPEKKKIISEIFLFICSIINGLNIQNNNNILQV